MTSKARWQVAAARGGRWTEQDARVALASWQGSGETMLSFSDEHGLGKRLERWGAKLRKRDEAERLDKPMALAPLVPVSVGGSSAVATIVVTDDEVRVEVADPSTAPAAWLGELVLSVRGERR